MQSGAIARAAATLAALPTRDNGCLLSRRMKNGLVTRAVAWRLGLPMDDPEAANRSYRERLAAALEASTHVARAVVLAMAHQRVLLHSEAAQLVTQTSSAPSYAPRACADRVHSSHPSPDR